MLANPPYVRQEKLDAEDQNSYEEAFPEVHYGHGRHPWSTSTLAPSRYSGPGDGFLSSPATSLCGLGTALASARIYRLLYASAVSWTSETCPSSRPTAKLLRPTRPCWWVAAPMIQQGMC